MNLHDKSYRRGLAVIFTIFLFIIIFAISKCGGNSNKKAIIPKDDTQQYYGVNPASVPNHDTLTKDTPGSDKYFADMEGQRGDIYNNRALLIDKIKRLDPTADFTGNYSEGSDKADDSFEAPDKYGSDFQITGSKKHVKEFNFTYRPSPYYPYSKNLEWSVMDKMGKLFGKNVGEEWIALYLAAINYSPNEAFKQSSEIGDLKFEIEYETENNTINFIITHK